MTLCVGPSCDQEAHEAIVGFLCKPALRRLERTVAEFPNTHSWLGENITGTRSVSEYVTGSTERPLPISTAIHDHQRQIVDVLNSWCRLVAEERDLRGPWRDLNPDGLAERDRLRRRVEQTATVNDLAAFLGAHLDWCATQAWVDELVREIGDLAKRAHGLAPQAAGKERYSDIPCGSCDLLALVRRHGEDVIRCEECGAWYTLEELERWQAMRRTA